MNSLPFITHHPPSTPSLLHSNLPSAPSRTLHPLITPPSASNFDLLPFQVFILTAYAPLTPPPPFSLHPVSPRQTAVADGGSYGSAALDAEGVKHFFRQRASLGSLWCGFLSFCMREEKKKEKGGERRGEEENFVLRRRGTERLDMCVMYSSSEFPS